MPPTLACALVCALVFAMFTGTAAVACQPDADIALIALNRLRASDQPCAPAAAALRWDARLASSAQRFAEELAQRDTLSHQGKAAVNLLDRLRAVDYPLRRAGENLAAGPDELADVLAQWLHSDAHCANLMRAEFRDVGLACATGSGRYSNYWVLHLGLTLASDPAEVDRP